MSSPHNASTDSDSLINKALHTRYFKRCLGILPPQMLGYDSSRTSLVYFCLASLDLLGTLHTVTTPEQRKAWADWIYGNITEDGSGFRGSPTHAILTKPNEFIKSKENLPLKSGVANFSDPNKLSHNAIASYDCGNMASTYFSLNSLAILRDDRITEFIDNKKMAGYIAKCQRTPVKAAHTRSRSAGSVYIEDTTIGSFAPNYSYLLDQPFGEIDPRCNFMAAGILFILHQLPKAGAQTDSASEEIDIDSATSFILSTQSYEGGFSGVPGTEGHSGYTYCGLSSLKLLLEGDMGDNVGILEKLSKGADWEKATKWLSRRQIWPTEGVTKPLHRNEDKNSQGDDDEDEDNVLEKEDGMHWRFDEEGGFNGRTNKQADTCYSFWSTASILVLNELLYDISKLYALKGDGESQEEQNADSFIDIPIHTKHAQMYLLNEAQDDVLGGFAREKGHRPDPYHSFLALTALSLLDEADQKNGQVAKSRYSLKRVVPHMCASQDTVDWIRGLQWE